MKAKQKMVGQPKLLHRPLPPKLPSKLSTPRENVVKGKLYKDSPCSFKFHVFSKINIEDRLEVKLLVQSSMSKTPV